jgi:hypothetical protein
MPFCLLYFTPSLLWQLADMRAPLHASSDPSAVFHFVDPPRFLAADLRLFSFSRDVNAAFAAAVKGPALVISMIQTESSLLQRSVAEEDCIPKRFCNDDMV